MADNTELPPGVGGDQIRDLARLAGTVKTQVVQLDLGGLSANAEKLITAGQQIMADSVPVVLASNQPDIAVTGNFFQATQPVSIAANVPVTGPLTDTQLRAAAVPVSGTFFQAMQPVSIAAMPSTPVTGTFFQATQPVSAAALPLPTGAATETTLAALNTKVTAVNTGAVTIATALPTGANAIGSITNTSFAATQATPASLQMTATPIALTKGTQGATGFTTQNLKDAGRNQTNYFMAAQVLSTATEALQLLTGYKGGAAVAATATPAVVTAGKVLRIERIVISYVSVATAGAIQVNLRANTAGVVAIGSPVVDSWIVGGDAVAAGVVKTIVINIPDGMEFAAGTGIGITVLGVGATGTSVVTGYAKISAGGYEY